MQVTSLHQLPGVPGVTGSLIVSQIDNTGEQTYLLRINKGKFLGTLNLVFLTGSLFSWASL